MRKTGMVMIRLVLFLFGAAGFTGLVMPLIKRRILNIGNAAGLSVCTILMLYALFMPYVNLLIGKWWQKKFGKLVLSIIGMGITAGIVLVIVITVCVVKALSVKPAQNATAVIL